jgi:Fe-S cluster biogenesis protein NfuA
MRVDSDIIVEPTAHPRARKFILGDDVRKGEGVTFSDPAACEHVPLAASLLRDEGISEVYLSGNVITITSTRGTDWTELEQRVRRVLEAELPNHDPAMVKDAVPAQLTAGDLAVIDGILEQTIRPYIRSHGGELELVDYEPDTHRLHVNYLGTCGSCPSSTSGTLEIIQEILREKFEPRINVEIVEI